MTLQRWQEITEWPILAAALLYLAAYSWQVLAPTPATTGTTDIVLLSVWVIFGVHYLISLALAPARGAWFIRHLHELLIVALPMFRPLRLLRLLTTLNMLHRVAGQALRGRVVTYVLGASILLIYVAALAMYDTERGHPEAVITSFGDSLWWAMVSVTTVGYGDLYPVTLTGRLIAVGLMIYGIALLGVITATMASWLIQQVNTEAEKNRNATAADLEELRQEITGLREALTKRADQGA